MNKKALKEIVKNYFVDNNRLLGIFIFIFIISNFMFIFTLGTNFWNNFLYIIIAFIGVMVFLFWKVWYITLLAYSDIKHKRFIKENVNFKEVKEDKSWILWNSNPKNTLICKYLASGKEDRIYRLCTNCNYQKLEAVNKFLTTNNFRIVQLEKSKLIVSIQSNPADFLDRKEAQEVAKITKNLFGPFAVPFTYKEND